MAKLSDTFFRQLWVLAAFSWLVYTTLVYYVSLFLKKVIVSKSRNNDPVNFVNCLKTLPKVPSHVALAFQYDKENGIFRGYVEEEDKYILEKPTLNLAEIGKVTGWIAGIGIPMISLYDYHGALKFHYSELKTEVEQACHEFAAKSATKEEEKIIEIIWHSVSTNSQCVKSDPHREAVLPGQVKKQVHIFLFSYEDGKPKLVNLVKDMYIEKYQNNIQSIIENTADNNRNNESVEKTEKPLIDINTVNEYLRAKCCDMVKTFKNYKMEPDLLISFGNIKSTLDFLPWHIRLTELHWLPPVKHVQLYEVLRSFYKYASCEQRFGK